MSAAGALPSIGALPVELFQAIAAHLDIKTCAALTRTCKYLSRVISRPLLTHSERYNPVIVVWLRRRKGGQAADGVVDRKTGDLSSVGNRRDVGTPGARYVVVV